MKKINLTIIILLINHFLFGQNSLVEGRVVSNDHTKSVSNVSVRLFNNYNTPLKQTSTDNYGDFRFDGITGGIYMISIKDPSAGDSIINSIKVSSNDTLDLILLNEKNCDSVNTIGICPYCGNSKNVVLTLPDSNRMVHFHYKHRRSAKRYFKKKAKLGYETDWDNIWPDLIKEQEYLVWIMSVEENKKFIDPCYHWFCKNCKKVF